MAKKNEEQDPILNLPLDEYLVARQDRVKNALKLIGADSCPEKMLFLELLWKGDFEEVHAGQNVPYAQKGGRKAGRRVNLICPEQRLQTFLQPLQE